MIPPYDVFITKAMVYLFPTSAFYSRLQFASFSIALVASYVVLLHSEYELLTKLFRLQVLPESLVGWISGRPGAAFALDVTPLMLLIAGYCTVVSLLMFRFKRSFVATNDWENPAVVQRRRLGMRVDSLRWFDNQEDSRCVTWISAYFFFRIAPHFLVPSSYFLPLTLS